MAQQYQEILASARNFSYNAANGVATLPEMEADYSPAAISARIKGLMKDKKLVHSDGRLNVTALYELVKEELKHRPDSGKKTITRQTVSNWVAGQSPKLEDLPYLAKVLDTQREYVLFGSKRDEQIKQERLYLSRVTEEEAALLTAFREASKPGQKTILKLAKDVAEDHPAMEASVHLMRRKDDRIKT